MNMAVYSGTNICSSSDTHLATVYPWTAHDLNAHSWLYMQNSSYICYGIKKKIIVLILTSLKVIKSKLSLLFIWVLFGNFIWIRIYFEK